MLKLHHFDRSPFSWKVRMVLAEKNVPYETVVPENKAESAEFARLNPLRLTPVLELPDGRTIYESTIVNEYLEEAHPRPAMLPKDPYERARVRILEDTADQYLYPAHGSLRKALYEYAPPFLIPKKPAEIDEKQVAEARAKLHSVLALFEKAIEGRTWFGGDMLSLADAGLVPAITGSLPLIAVLPDARYPGLEAWTRRVKERPSYRESAPKQPLTIQTA
jgi:glutathione S-transferase